jgi:hypothetical protein
MSSDVDSRPAIIGFGDGSTGLLARSIDLRRADGRTEVDHADSEAWTAYSGPGDPRRPVGVGYWAIEFDTLLGPRAVLEAWWWSLQEEPRKFWLQARGDGRWVGPRWAFEVTATTPRPPLYAAVRGEDYSGSDMLVLRRLFLVGYADLVITEP